MSATGDTAVANHVDPVADSVDDLSELIEWAPRSIELTAAVIGYHDPSRADVHGAFCVRNAHDSLEAELLAPFLADIRGVLPVHRLVQHRAEIVPDRNRNIRTLFHVVLQLGQFEFLVHEIVGRPPRMRDEAEKAINC